MRNAISLLGALALAGCMSDEPVVTVYEGGPALQQCSAPVTSLQQSALKLAGVGVAVVTSSCGNTGLSYAAVCGAPTGQVLLHDIPERDVAKAESAGFARADSMQDDPATGWQRMECPNR